MLLYLIQYIILGTLEKLNESSVAFATDVLVKLPKYSDHFRDCMKNYAKIFNDYRGVFKTQSNIYDVAFCENNQWLLVVNYFQKELYRRLLNGF